MREVSDDRLVRSWVRRGLNLLIVAVIAYFLAGAAVLLSLSPPLPRPSTEPEAAGNGVKSSIPTLDHFSPILERNAFLAARPAPQSGEAPPDDLPVAQSDVKLIGTFYFEFPGLSRAVTLEGSEQKLVKVGDSVDGYRVAEIQRGTVILERGGQRHQLMIDIEEWSGAIVSTPIASVDPDMEAMDINAPLFQDEVSSPDDSAAPVFKEAPPVKLDREALARDIGLAPIREGGENGLVVRDLRDGSPFSKAGLMQGDIVTAVDGKPVPAGADLGALFQEVDSLMIEMTVIRDGEPVMLIVPLTEQ